MTLSVVTDAAVADIEILPFESVLDRSGRRALRSRMTSTEFVRDQLLAREGDVQNDLLIVSGGVLKLWKAMCDGRRQIIAFRVDGDVISMHRSNTPWPVTVQAVTAGSVHRIPWQALHDLAARNIAIERLLLDLAGDEIASLHAHLLSLGRRTTEEKLASFLLDACRPRAMQSRLSREHHLPMRR